MHGRVNGEGTKDKEIVAGKQQVMDEEPEEKTRCTPGKKILAVALAVVLFFPAIALLLLWFLLGRSRLLVVLASAVRLAYAIGESKKARKRTHYYS